jgi:RsiW-degrading membrane proteinase PrsW (M82 family)
MVWIFASAGTLGITAAAIGQMAICKLASFLIFRSNDDLKKKFWLEFSRTSVEGLSLTELAQRAVLASSWQNWVFNGVLTFLAAGLVEETLKYLPIIWARRQKGEGDGAYLDYVMSGALSFGVVEGIGFLYAQKDVSNSQFALTLLERIVPAQIGHLSMAALTALRATRRDHYGDQLGWWGVVGPSVLYHGLFDFVAMSASALEGNVGWIHPQGAKVLTMMFGLCGGLVSTAVWQVWKEWKGIEERAEEDVEGRPHV